MEMWCPKKPETSKLKKKKKSPGKAEVEYHIKSDLFQFM